MNEENDTDDYKSILNGIEIGTEATRTGIIENAKLYKYRKQITKRENSKYRKPINR